MSFGAYVRTRRQHLARKHKGFSIRQLALRIGVEPSYLSKVERDEVRPPSEAKIVALARELGDDPDLLLAVAGLVSSVFREAFLKRPQLFGELIRQLKNLPDHAILRVVREVRDGNW